MNEWDGVERRNMSQDQVNRDRLLTEVHSDMKHLLDWARTHDTSDNDRFDAINKRTAWVEKIAYCGIGGLAVLNIVLKAIH